MIDIKNGTKGQWKLRCVLESIFEVKAPSRLAQQYYCCVECLD